MLPLSIFKQSGKGYRLFLKCSVYHEKNFKQITKTNSTDARSRPTNFSAS
jgi:hypothetical protein